MIVVDRACTCGARIRIEIASDENYFSSNWKPTWDALKDFTEAHRECHRLSTSAIAPPAPLIFHHFTPGCVHDYGEPDGTGGTRTCRKCGASFTYTTAQDDGA